MKIQNILLIDDNEVDNFVNQHLVIKSNIAETITVKESAIEALEYLKTLDEKFPEIIFLDIRMPGMDGFEFLNHFEKFPVYLKEKCTVYMLSSSLSISDLDRATNNPNVKKFLNKPLDLDSLSDIGS